MFEPTKIQTKLIFYEIEHNQNNLSCRHHLFG